jgi:hypothetical protein
LVPASHDAARRRPPAKRAARALVAVLFVVVGLAGLWNTSKPTLESHFYGLQSDIGDPLLSAYLLEHELRSLTVPGYIGTFWSPPFFYPAHGVLAYSEHMAGVLPIYALARPWCSPILAYQIVVLACVVLCFLTMAALLAGLGVRPALTALGAYIFAFGMPRVLQMGHLHILTAFFSPLVLLALYRLLASPGRLRLAALLVVLYLQLMAGIYLGWFLLFGLAILVPVWLLYDLAAARRLAAFARSRPLYCGLAVLAWLGLTYASFRPFLIAGQEFGYRSWDDVAIFLPSPSLWFTVARGSIYGHLLPVLDPISKNPWERSLFAGFTLIGLSMIAALHLLTQRRRAPAPLAPPAPSAPPASSAASASSAAPAASAASASHDTLPAQTPPDAGNTHGRAVADPRFLLACATSALVLIALSLVWPRFTLEGWHLRRAYPAITLWWSVFKHVPGGAAFRAVARIWTVVYLLAIPFAMGGTEGALRRVRNRLEHHGRLPRLAGCVLLTGLVVFGIAEQHVKGLPAGAKEPFFARVQRIQARIPPGCRAIYAPIKPGRTFFVGDLAAMWAGLQANVPVVNGYSSNFPHGYPDPMLPMTPAQLKTWAGDGICVVSAD